MKNLYIALIGLLVCWTNIVSANSHEPNTTTITTTVTVNATNYPAKLTLICTKDEGTNIKGALSLNISVPTTIADKLPINEIEGPEAKLSVKAKIHAHSQTQQKSFQALIKTSTWFDENNNLVFGMSESHKTHSKLYQLANYLAKNTSALEITLENPKKNQPDLLITKNLSTEQVAIKNLLKTCYKKD